MSRRATLWKHVKHIPPSESAESRYRITWGGLTLRCSEHHPDHKGVKLLKTPNNNNKNNLIPSVVAHFQYLCGQKHGPEVRL